MHAKAGAMIAVIALLSACVSSGSGSGGSGAAAATSPRPIIRKPVTRPARNPQLQVIPGLEGVIGANEGQLTRTFGAARLNVWEGDARKLQFQGSACVLDIYLYPTTNSREPIATYIDARRASDGKDVDRISCIRALRRR